MNRLLITILLLGSSFIGIAQAMQYEPLKASVNEVKNRMVILEFKNLNKRIWIVDAKESDIHFLSHSTTKTVTASGARTTILITGTASIKVYSAKIDASLIEVDIDNVPMGKNLGAVIDKSGKVTMGAFIRTFDR